jgi:hypothetical protein
MTTVGESPEEIRPVDPMESVMMVACKKSEFSSNSSLSICFHFPSKEDHHLQGSNPILIREISVELIPLKSALAHVKKVQTVIHTH